MAKNDAPKIRKIDKKQILIIVGALVAIGLVGAAAFFYKHQHDDMNKRLAAAQSQAGSLQKQVQALQKSLKAASTKSGTTKDPATPAPTPVQTNPTLSLDITGVTKDSRGYGYSGDYAHEQILVDVSLTNNTKASLPVSLSDFKLKDGNNVEYTTASGAEWPPAANKTALNNQSLDPGETLKGTISFGNVPVSFDTFRLYYRDQVNTVTPKDATYGWYTYPWCTGIEGTGIQGC